MIRRIIWVSHYFYTVESHFYIHAQKYLLQEYSPDRHDFLSIFFDIYPGSMT
uniref:Uncharacterized protein n=1 Tax=Meloidogyne enterolobii TaxID=390850 RepID=A0A6V7TN47_MELEN|nr:unnamed protein product [Meloidogyne enterolobii]